MHYYIYIYIVAISLFQDWIIYTLFVAFVVCVIVSMSVYKRGADNVGWVCTMYSFYVLNQCERNVLPGSSSIAVR